MSLLNIVNNFDGIVFDVKSSSVSIGDIDKLVESNTSLRVIVKNWDKYFLSNNFKYLNRIKKSAELSFSVIGRNNADISQLNEFTSGMTAKTQQAKVKSSQMFFAAPWISMSGGKYIWSNMNLGMEPISSVARRWIDSAPSGMPFVFITTDPENGITDSTVSKLLGLSGSSKYLISIYAGLINPRRGITPVLVLSIDSFQEILNDKERVFKAISDLYINNVLIVMRSSVNKSKVTFEEYSQIQEIKKTFGLFLYGNPVDQSGGVSKDLDRFKWTVNVNNISKLTFDLDQFNINNLYYI
jgi:hypothetical protein